MNVDQDGARVGELVVRVGEEHRVHARWQVRIGRIAKQNPDVVIATLRCAEPEKRQGQSPDVFCNDTAVVTYFR